MYVQFQIKIQNYSNLQVNPELGKRGIQSSNYEQLERYCGDKAAFLLCPLVDG